MLVRVCRSSLKLAAELSVYLDKISKNLYYQSVALKKVRARTQQKMRNGLVVKKVMVL